MSFVPAQYVLATRQIDWEENTARSGVRAAGIDDSINIGLAHALVRRVWHQFAYVTLVDGYAIQTIAASQLHVKPIDVDFGSNQG